MSQKESLDDLMTVVEGGKPRPRGGSTDDAATAYSDASSKTVMMEDPAARFKIVGELGHGGMGVVYKARDTKLGRIVALKSLRPENLENRKVMERFWREAKVIASLNHFNIIQIYNVLEVEQGLWIEMEFVTGGSLKDRVETQGPLTEDEAVEMGAQLADALYQAHEKGICHRDVKPGNILLTDRGTPKLGDFGLAQDREGASDMTLPGTLMGTMFFAAPEQLTSGRNADQRSDVYGLGATLYAALTGEAPRTIRLEKVPEKIRPVIAKCLEEHPDKRYPSAAELAAALLGCRTRSGLRGQASCPRCGYVNSEGVRFCSKCGQSLSALLEKCGKCGAEVGPDTVFCGRCGGNVPLMRLVRKAQEALTASDFKKSEGFWTEVLEIDPENEQARLGLARIARNREEIAGHLNRAESALAADNKEAAWAAFRDVLTLDPRRAEIRARMEALTPELVEMRLRRARTALSLKKYEKAHELASGALEMEPENTDAAILMAEIGRFYKPAAASRMKDAAGAVVSMDLTGRPANKKVYMAVAFGVLALFLGFLVLFGGASGNEFDAVAEQTLVGARTAARASVKTGRGPNLALEDLAGAGLKTPAGVEIRIVNPNKADLVIEASHAQGKLIYHLDPGGLITSRKK